jgi:hypothetical protein
MRMFLVFQISGAGSDHLTVAEYLCVLKTLSELKT